MTNHNDASQDETSVLSDREIVLSRVLNAPRELVWRAWTEPEQFPAWWGPNGFSTTLLEMDARPGGVSRFVMRSPDGVEYPDRIVYVEVVPPERMVYFHGEDHDDDPNRFHVTVTFDDQGGKTALTMRSVFPSVEECERVKGFGAVELGYQTLARLEEYVTAKAG